MLAELDDRHPSVGEVRSIGLFGVIELVRNRKTREPLAPLSGSSPEMAALRKYLLDHGCIRVYPLAYAVDHSPLIITQSNLMIDRP